MLRNVRIATALLAIVAVFLVFQLVVGGLAYFGLTRLNEDVRDLHRNAVVQGNAVNAAALSLVAARTDLSRYATRVAQDKAGETTSLRSGQTHIGNADRSFAQFESSLGAAADSAATAGLVRAYRAFSRNLQGVATVLQAGDMDAYLKQGTQGVQDEFMRARDAFMADSEARGTAVLEGVEGFTGIFTSVLAAVLALGSLAAVGAILLMRRMVVHPLNQTGELLKRIAAGNLANRIPRHGRNEVGELLAALRTMQEGLAQTVRQVRVGVEEIHVSAHEISSGNADLSARTAQQAASLQETAASMEELAATVKQNAGNARQANQLASAASSVAQRGHGVVDGVVQTMDGISESSARIAEIVGVIDSIAFQTNILALNAAVEAARAGEQGKGFAVVATEVRSLAQRSAGAAREIKKLIDDSTGKVVLGSQQVASAGATMREIVESVRRVPDIMGEIAAASEEQATGIDQVNRAVVQMDGVTQQNAALVEQSAAAAGSLESQAGMLNHAVAAFKLPDAIVIDDAHRRIGAQAAPQLAGQLAPA